MNILAKRHHVGSILNDLLIELGIRPVLVDIGASGEPPMIWDGIAGQSTYLGFDPDLREMRDIPDGHFARSIIMNKAVTSDREQREVRFHLASFPYCSSTLMPDTKSLSDYLFSDMFAVKQTQAAEAVSLNSVLDSLALDHVDWFKTDSQGTDLRLFRSLDDSLRSRVLAVDVEPGLMDAYIGEDLFVDTHKQLTAEGFWLSRLNVEGSPRIRKETVEELYRQNGKVKPAILWGFLRTSPCWCEARYMRTTDRLTQQSAGEKEFVLLWVFAMLDDQLGFALDIALAYQRKFGDSTVSRRLFDEPSQHIVRKASRSRFSLKGIQSGLRWRLRRFYQECGFGR